MQTLTVSAFGGKIGHPHGSEWPWWPDLPIRPVHRRFRRCLKHEPSKRDCRHLLRADGREPVWGQLPRLPALERQPVHNIRWRELSALLYRLVPHRHQPRRDGYGNAQRRLRCLSRVFADCGRHPDVFDVPGAGTPRSSCEADRKRGSPNRRRRS